jgi:predicted amidohydrolase YtcJ
MNEAGTKTYFPENKLTRGQALYAYTQGSAYAEFAENHKGKLVPGYDADFILVDRDLFKVAPPEILHTTVRETWVNGQKVFAQEQGSASSQGTGRASISPKEWARIPASPY